jgi:hypothetical protein
LQETKKKERKKGGVEEKKSNTKKKVTKLLLPRCNRSDKERLTRNEKSYNEKLC